MVEARFEPAEEGYLRALCPRLSLKQVNVVRSRVAVDEVARLRDGTVFVLAEGQRGAFEEALRAAAPAPEGDATVPLYYDYGSPYAFLATRLTERLEAECCVRFEWRCFDYTQGRHRPIRSAEEQRARWEQWRAVARAWLPDPPLERPTHHRGQAFRPPAEPLYLAALYARWEGAFAEFNRALFDARFLQDRDLRYPGVLLNVAEEVGLNAAAMERSIREGVGREFLAEWRLWAERDGVFGVPTYVVGDQTVWGRFQCESLKMAFAREGIRPRKA